VRLLLFSGPCEIVRQMEGVHTLKFIVALLPPTSPCFHLVLSGLRNSVLRTQAKAQPQTCPNWCNAFLPGSLEPWYRSRRVRLAHGWLAEQFWRGTGNSWGTVTSFHAATRFVGWCGFMLLTFALLFVLLFTIPLLLYHLTLLAKQF